MTDRGKNPENSFEEPTKAQPTAESATPPESVAEAEASGPSGGRTGAERKEKVLHTRIPGSLDDEIKRRAQTLGMSVSTVVRNVLASTFDLVENVVHDSAQTIADETAGTSRPRRAGHPGDSAGAAFGAGATGEILGWQEAKLQINAVCDRCNTILAKGTTAAIAVRDGVGSRTIVCVNCQEALVAEGDPAVPTGTVDPS